MGRKISAFVKAARRSISDPQKRSSWQGRTGILVFLLFIISSLAVNQVVQALNQSAGSYGYYGGTYGYNSVTSSSDALPSAPTSLTASNVQNTVATPGWTAPTTTTDSTSLDNLDHYIYRIGTSSSTTTCASGKATTDTTASVTLTGLTKNTTYYFAVCAVDSNNNESDPLTGTFITAGATSSSESSSSGGGGGSSSDDSTTTDDTTTDDSTAVTVEVGETTESTSFTVGTPSSVSVGGSSHTVTVSVATETEAMLTIESDPVTITVAAGETEDIDTDGDGIDDLRVGYDGLDDDGEPMFTFSSLEVVYECEMPSGTGTSPVTGDEEDITDVEAGDFIKSDSYSTVYYVTSDCGRRVFMNSQAYFSWQDSFDTLVTVTDATLTGLSLEGIMLPKAGTTMVKIQSDAKVYCLADGDDMFTPDLRWVTSEDVAEDAAGSSWADYIIDIEATFFSYFGSGDDLEDGSDVDASDLITREVLSQ